MDRGNQPVSEQSADPAEAKRLAARRRFLTVGAALVPTIITLKGASADPLISLPSCARVVAEDDELFHDFDPNDADDLQRLAETVSGSCLTSMLNVRTS